MDELFSLSSFPSKDGGGSDLYFSGGVRHIRVFFVGREKVRVSEGKGGGSESVDLISKSSGVRYVSLCVSVR